MYVITLIDQSDNSTLKEGFTRQISSKIGAHEHDWLEEDIACDFYLNEVPSDVSELWRKLQDQRIDMVVQPLENRRKKILLADMDSTMIEQECIDELADAVGVGEEVVQITARSMNGELVFEDSLIERVALLKGLDESVIQDVIDTRISLMAGGQTLVATMKAHGAYAALVSGGFTQFTNVIADKLGFDENRANTFIIKNGKLTGEVTYPILGQDAKIEAMEEICEHLDMSLQDVIAVGDGANDLGMLKVAGSGVAAHAKPTVSAQADMVLNHCDLTGLLYIQGYKRSEFASA